MTDPAIYKEIQNLCQTLDELPPLKTENETFRITKLAARAISALLQERAALKAELAALTAELEPRSGHTFASLQKMWEDTHVELIRVDSERALLHTRCLQLEARCAHLHLVLQEHHKHHQETCLVYFKDGPTEMLTDLGEAYAESDLADRTVDALAPEASQDFLPPAKKILLREALELLVNLIRFEGHQGQHANCESCTRVNVGQYALNQTSTLPS